MNKSSVRLTIILFSTAILIIGSIIYLTQVIVQNQVDEVMRYKSNQVRILSDDANSRILITSLALNMTANSPVFRTIHPELIDEKLHGIPTDAEPTKRELADNLLANHDELDYVFFLLPDGKMYFLEPYWQQMNLTKNNFAYRDYYKGVMSTHAQYISEVYISNNNKQRVVAIATPAYSKTDGSLTGIWVGVLNLKIIDNSLSLLKLGKNARLVYLDQHGNIVADSSKGDKSGAVFGNLESYKNAFDGKEGTMIETVNDTKMFVAYTPLKLMGNTWVVMLIQPYDDTYASEITTTKLLFIDILIIVIILGISGYYSYRLSHQNTLLVEKLKEDDIKKEEFSAMVTHELKTPLVPIIGYCKMFKTSMLGALNQDQLEGIEIIEKNTKRLESLITDIMDVRKLDLGKIKFKIDNLSLDEFFSDLNSDYRQVSENKGCKFTTSIYDKNLMIKTDRIRLRQVFDNLINNAIKFVPENGGKIDVGCLKENGNLVFYVKDNGTGIPPEKQKQLFQKFYQIDTSDSRPIGGTGLGLAISKGIIEKLGGTISVESDGKTGTIFYVKFQLKYIFS